MTRQEHRKKWKLKNPSKMMDYKKRWAERNPEKIAFYQWRQHIRRKYKISVEEYNNLFESCQGRCSICNVRQTECKKKLAVDHNHTDGKIRGLLCSQCNVGLGMFNDDPNLLLKAIEYLHI